MTRVLFGWELGANLGHLSLAATLRGDSSYEQIDPLFVVTDLVAARSVLGPDARLLQAPSWPPYIHQGAPIGATSYADVLTYVGFNRPEWLSTMIGAWLEIFDLEPPDLLLLDHAPTAVLAARIRNIPTIQTGTGFTMPPLEAPVFPPLRGDLVSAVPEAQLQMSIATAMRVHGYHEHVASLPSYFDSGPRLVVGLPELDPYRSFRQEDLLAPPQGLPTAAPPVEPRLFAYLGSELPRLTEVLQTLCSLKMPVDIYVRGADRFTLEFIRLRGKVAYETPADLIDLLPKVSHVISQGGATMCSMVLSAGRPHLVLPMHHETRLNAGLVARLGAGLEIADLSDFANGLDRFLANVSLQETAASLGAVLGHRALPNSRDRFLELVRAMVPAAKKVPADVDHPRPHSE